MRTALQGLDRVLGVADDALRTLSGSNSATRPRPLAVSEAVELDGAERRLSGALMRVNHVGEVCAQALYRAQSLAASDAELRSRLDAAAQEETDHLVWTRERLRELGDRPSWLNPLWYAGAFGIGLVAGRLGNAWSLGFVVETERQVERHLDGHLDRLPARDAASRVIVEQMKADEAAHASDAERAGGRTLPLPVRLLMRTAAKVMTTVAHRV